MRLGPNRGPGGKNGLGFHAVSASRAGRGQPRGQGVSVGLHFDASIGIDYSGAGRDDQPTSAIRVVVAGEDLGWLDDLDDVVVSAVAAEAAEGVAGRGTAHRAMELRPRPGRRKTAKWWSRNRLREGLRAVLVHADHTGRRVLVGIDHQTGWPLALWRVAGLAHRPWREAIAALSEVDAATGRPRLAAPPEFCAAFNAWAEGASPRITPAIRFWSPLRRVAQAYGIPSRRPEGVARFDALRLVERVAASGGAAGGSIRSPSPADAVGGQGEGVVGGQTICGLAQISRLLRDAEASGIQLRCWPHDGLNIAAAAYAGSHVLVEVYPSMHRPATAARTDANDALWSALALDAIVRSGRLEEFGLFRCDDGGGGTASVPLALANQIRLEGWIFGIPSVVGRSGSHEGPRTSGAD